MSLGTMRQEKLWRERQRRYDEKIEKGEALTGPEGYQYTHVPTDGISAEKVFMGFILLKLAKMPGGLRVIERLGREFIKGIFDTLHALGQASAANSVAAWANPYLVNLVLDRFGFVYSQGSSEFKLGLGVLAGLEVTEDFITILKDSLPWNLLKPPTPSEFPSSIVYSARREGDVLKEEVKGKAVTAKDVEQLRKLLK